jgi:hypothetical protein
MLEKKHGREKAGMLRKQAITVLKATLEHEMDVLPAALASRNTVANIQHNLLAKVQINTATHLANNALQLTVDMYSKKERASPSEAIAAIRLLDTIVTAV